MKPTRWAFPRIGLAFAALIVVFGGCNSHPLVHTGGPKVVVTNPPMLDDAGQPLDLLTPVDLGTVPDTVPDAEAPDVLPEPDRPPPPPDGQVADLADLGIDSPDLASDSILQPDAGIDQTRDLGIDAGFGLVSFIQSVGGTPVRVLKRDQYVYLGDWENYAKPPAGSSGSDGSIQTYDVTDPRFPVLRSTLFTSAHQIQDLAISGQWLFAANDALGLRLVDIADPSDLKSVTNRLSDGSDFATSVAATVRGGDASRQLYALAGYLYGGGLDIHAVPEGGPIPNPVHYTSSVLTARCDVHQVQVSGDRAYILASDGELTGYVEILDISQLPAVPTALGRVKLPFTTYGGIGDIRLSGDFLYFSASDYTRTPQKIGGLRIIDVKDPKAPALVGSLDLPPRAGAIDWKGTGLAVAGKDVYFITPSGVAVIDVSTPTQPTLRTTAAFPASFGTCQGGTAVVEGDLLYVGVFCSPTGGQGGLAIYRR